MVGISTSCGDYKKLRKIVEKINIFFAELNYRDTINDFFKNKRIFDKYGIPFLGVHSPAPLVKKIKGASRLIDLISEDKEIVKNSIKYIENSIRFAKERNMKYVIIHAGGNEEIGEEILKKGRKEFLKEFLKEREKKSKIYLLRFFKNFEKLLKISEELKINIALEIRFYPGEFPNFFELSKIFEEINSKSLYYWHDLGHAYVREKVLKEPSYLKNFKDKILGIHIHDIKGFDEHRPPFNGEINFKELFKEIEKIKNIYLVFEINKKYKDEEIIKGIRKIERIWGINKFISRKDWKPYKINLDKMNLNFPERIIIHHTAIPSRKDYEGLKTIKKIQREHLKRNFNDIGYHFLITPYGEIVCGRNIYYEGAHTKSKNKNSIGIALIGNFEEEKPLKRQLRALKNLVFNLKKIFKIKEIKMHRDYNKYTLCPGKFFIREFKR
ncbi:MAG: TIM barrel protein [candidate division WOR-3 bacterium]